MGPGGETGDVSRVYVYRNLNTGTWSVRALDGPNRGRVVSRPAELALRDATFRVSAVGRDRVRATGVRFVHAGVVGHLAALPSRRAPSPTLVTYSPFRDDSFVSVPDGAAVVVAALVHFPAQPRGGSRPLRAWGVRFRDAEVAA